jgi:putative transposase
MGRIDELYMPRPFYGRRRVSVELGVNRKRVQRLMRTMGLEALYSRPRLSRPSPAIRCTPTCCAT